MCGQQFSHGEARLQQWSNRQTNNHCVHAHCVNGGLGHDHELHPKQAGDQESVDAVARQRETIIRTASDTEVLPPFVQDPDQASTAAPADDEQDLFGREEALRIDEELMDFQSFDNIPWDSIKDLRGTTYFQPPPWFRFALQQAQHGILRAMIHNNLSSLASELAWKALVLSSWFLLGRPAVNTSESNCAHFVDARHDLFWAEDWSALWAMVRAEYDVAPVQNATRRKDEPWLQKRTASPSHGAYPTDPEPPAPAHAFVSNLFLSEVAELFPTTLRKMPRFSEPRPLGMRAEHWYDFGSLAGNSNLFASCCTISSGSSSPFSATVPQSWTDHTARQTHRRTQISTHDVLSQQVGTQISHGSKERISCQMCWTFAVWCWTTR